MKKLTAVLLGLSFVLLLTPCTVQEEYTISPCNVSRLGTTATECDTV